VTAPVESAWLEDGELEQMDCSDPLLFVKLQFKDLKKLASDTREEARQKISFSSEDVVVDLICHKSRFRATYYFLDGKDLSVTSRKFVREEFRNIDDAAASVVLRVLGADFVEI